MPILKDAVEIATKEEKKSLGIDYIPGELIKNGEKM